MTLDMTAALADELKAAVDTGRLVATASDLVSIASPTGQEQACADYIRSQLRELGLSVVARPVEDGRPNVVGTLEGSTGSRALMFAGHMDTSYSGSESWAATTGFQPNATVRDGRLYGLGISNMKGALAAFLEAIRAIRDVGVHFRNDLILAAVCGEIEKTQWEGFEGREYRGYGVGSRGLPVSGTVPDWCILGEATEHKLVLGHFGTMWTRVSVGGPFVHTAWSGALQGDNSIARMQQVIPVIQEWIQRWTASAAEGGVPSVVNIGAVRGGMPWRLSRTPARTDLFLDIRVPPSMAMQTARESFRELIEALRRRFPEFGVDFEIFLAAPGTLLAASDRVVEAVAGAHDEVFGQKPETDVVRWFCDASAYAMHGIKTAIYGPSSGLPGPDGENLDIAELADFARAYSLVAATLCEAIR